jgi:hypothetical protein
MKLLAITAALASHRYGELEKQIQRETDPVKRAALVRDLNHIDRTRRRP